MTSLKPTLLIRRLQIERGEHVVYDENFHAGINVIRGENSSGKSTIINSIFYGLGGDLVRWSDAAARCTRINIEVSLNDKAATLSREISPQSGQPMDIFGGTLDQSRAAPRSEWLRYPYRRSPSRESFSQAVFRLLEMPEAANDESGNVTIHQTLRLMYSDQLSPVEQLFRSDPFDSANTRDTVGRLLCGAFDDELYANDLRIRDLTREFDQKAAELRSILAVLGKTDHSLTTEWLNAERARLIQERGNILTAIDVAQRTVMSSATGLSLTSQQRAYDALKTTQAELADLRQKRDRHLLEIADSNAFIAGLEQKLQAVSDANLTALAFGDVRFSHCPSCHAPIEESEGADMCHLCKAPFDPERSQRRIVAIINDISIQLKQSRQLQTEREEELAKIEQQLEALARTFRQQSAEFAQNRRNPTDEAQITLNELQRRLGYIDRQIEELDGRGRLIEEVERLTKEKDAINDQLGQLTTRNEVLKANQARRLSLAYDAISENTRWFVVHDLRREDAFEDAKRVDFNFRENKLTVDGQEYFSASSRVILKNSFIAGFLFAALQNDFFRHFRFLLMDTMEDKGMEPVRSQNFQNLLRERSAATEVDHQIIFATSMISPDLDEDRYTIGDFSTRDNPTLKLLGG